MTTNARDAERANASALTVLWLSWTSASMSAVLYLRIFRSDEGLANGSLPAPKAITGKEATDSAQQLDLCLFEQGFWKIDCYRQQ